MTASDAQPGFPLPDLDEPRTAGFWRAAAEHRLALPHCGRCRQYRWYPPESCPGCGGAELPWTDVAGTGTVFSWSVPHHAFLPAYAGRTPFVAALVALDAAPGVRLATRIVDARPDELTVDAPVEVRFDTLSYPGVPGSVQAPFFRLRRSDGGRST